MLGRRSYNNDRRDNNRTNTNNGNRNNHNYAPKRDLSWFNPLDPKRADSIVDRVYFTDIARDQFKIAAENINAGMNALKTKFKGSVPITEFGGKRPYEIADSFLRSKKRPDQREGWYYIDAEDGGFMIFVVVPSEREGTAIFVCPLILKISGEPDEATLESIKVMAKGVTSFNVKEFDGDIHKGHA